MTKFLIIDRNMNSVEINISELSPEDQKVFFSLIDTSSIKRNKNKRNLNNEISNWIQSVKHGKN